jgi:hypothetical protein
MKWTWEKWHVCKGDATYHKQFYRKFGKYNKTGNVQTANVTMSRFHVTIHALDKQQVLYILRVYL